MPSVLFQRSPDEAPLITKGRPKSGGEKMPKPETTPKPPRIDLASRANAVKAKRAAEILLEQQRLAALEERDRKATETLKQHFAPPLASESAEKDLITNESVPLDTRRGMAEEQAETLMESTLALQKKEQAALKNNDREALLEVREELVSTQTGLRNALLRESFLETEDPKAAQAGYAQLVAEEEFLHSDEQALKVKLELDRLRTEQKVDAILPEMIKQLSTKDQGLATRWFHAENDRRKTDFHVSRLQTWHEKKSALDIARTEAITLCKTCRVPADIREKITSEKYTRAERAINLNRATSDGYTREFDQPRDWKESLIGAGLSIARTLGIETKRKFANGELEARMQEVDSLQKAFEEIADTKGKFVGRRSPYQRRTTGADTERINPSYTVTPRDAVIGRSEFTRQSASEVEGYKLLDSISREVKSTATTLDALKGTIGKTMLAEAREMLTREQKRLEALGKTALADSGEYHLAQEDLKKAQGVLAEAEAIHQAQIDEKERSALAEREAKAAALQEKKEHEIKVELMSISKEAGAITELIDRTENEMTKEDLARVNATIETLKLDLVSANELQTTKEYKAADNAILEAEESAKMLRVTLSSKKDRSNKGTGASAKIAA